MSLPGNLTQAAQPVCPALNGDALKNPEKNSFSIRVNMQPAILIILLTGLLTDN